MSRDDLNRLPVFLKEAIRELSMESQDSYERQPSKTTAVLKQLRRQRPVGLATSPKSNEGSELAIVILFAPTHPLRFCPSGDPQAENRASKVGRDVPCNDFVGSDFVQEHNRLRKRDELSKMLLDDVACFANA